MGDDARFAVIDPSGQDVEAASLPVDALSLGRGVFETVLIVNGRCVLAERHEARLAAGCEALAIADPDSASRLFAHACVFAAAATWDLSRLRLAVFGQRGAAEPVGLIALREAVIPRRPSRLTMAAARRSRLAATSTHKTVDYIENLLAGQAALEAGFDDAIVLDDQRRVAETTRANIFLEIDGKLMTPPEGAILPGIVRGWVLETAAALGIDVAVENIPAESLKTARAGFLTNSIAGLRPVGCIGQLRLAEAKDSRWFPGLEAAYRELISATAAPR